jgi:hypothetical protein
VVEVWEREVRAAWARKVVRELCRVVVGLGGGGEVAVVVGGSGGLVSSCEFVVRSGGGGEVVEEDWVEERHRCWAGRRSGGQRSGVVRLGLWQHFVRERASIKEFMQGNCCLKPSSLSLIQYEFTNYFQGRCKISQIDWKLQKKPSKS